MKSITQLFLCLILALFVYEKGFSQQIGGSIYQPIGVLKDGNYNAIVQYYNPSTYTKSTYELVVTVKGDRVTAIHFPNQGSLHSGYNNSGYSYNGGNLSFQYSKNSSGQSYVSSASTSVTIRYSNGSQTVFNVTL